MDVFKRLIYRIIWKIFKPHVSDFINYVESVGINLYPKIASIDETIEELISNNKSIARYGDGELMLCLSRAINFQKNDLLLKKRLREILRNDNNSCLVGIPDYNPLFFSPFWWQFWYENTKNVVRLLNTKTKYYNQGISRGVNLNQIERLKTLWDDRNVIFVYGRGSRFDINHEIFSKVAKKNKIEGLAINAWCEYDFLYQNVLNLSQSVKNPLIICSLGPTATVLAYDLSRNNLQTIDLGHLNNVYDMLKYGSASPEELPSES
jgi:glycosyltransferase family protein